MHIGERLKIEREEEGEGERERESGEELSDGFDGTRGRSPFFVTSSRLVHAGKSDFCQLESYRSSWILYKRRDYFRDEGRVLEWKLFEIYFLEERGGRFIAEYLLPPPSFSFFFSCMSMSMEFFENCCNFERNLLIVHSSLSSIEI